MWLIKNWKLVVLTAAFLALIGTGTALYQKGKAAARQVALIARLQEENDFLLDQARRFAKSLEDHAARAREDAEHIAELNDRITSLDEYVETLEDRDRVCLSGPDVDRLRDLWK